MSSLKFFSRFSFVLLWCLYPSSKSAPPQTYGQGATCATLGYDSTWCSVGCLNGWCCATASGCGMNGCGTANCCYLMVGESITCGSKSSVSICLCWSTLFVPRIHYFFIHYSRRFRPSFSFIPFGGMPTQAVVLIWLPLTSQHRHLPLLAEMPHRPLPTGM